MNSYSSQLLIGTRHMKQLSKLFAFHTVNTDCAVGIGMICQLMLLLGSTGENMNIDLSVSSNNMLQSLSISNSIL